MRRMNKRTLAEILALLIALLAFAAACEMPTGAPPAQQTAADQRQAVYDYLKANFPVDDPDWSNDLININFWVDTWATAANAEGKAAYVYLLDMQGDLIGYYITDGLPTAKCKMATPTYDFENRDSGDATTADMLVPAPGLTGTYSSGSGECNIYYAKDLSSGAYMEWMAGGGINQLVYDQPLPLPEGVNPPPLGFTTFDDVKED